MLSEEEIRKFFEENFITEPSPGVFKIPSINRNRKFYILTNQKGIEMFNEAIKKEALKNIENERQQG